jgi:microcin C transport system substrate-binding protein
LEHFSVKLTRRTLISATAGTLTMPAIGTLGKLPFVRFAEAAEPAWKHGLSLFGDVKYPQDFKHFDYVNPAAPKGGLVRQVGIGTFDNFNQVVSGVKGSLAMGLGLVIETLTTPALHEVSSEYGQMAELVSNPSDPPSVTNPLRHKARWH